MSAQQKPSFFFVYALPPDMYAFTISQNELLILFQFYDNNSWMIFIKRYIPQEKPINGERPACHDLNTQYSKYFEYLSSCSIALILPN